MADVYLAATAHNATQEVQAAGLSGTGAVHGAVSAPSVSGVEDAAVQAAAQATASMPMESAFSWGGYFQAIGVLLLLLVVLWGAVWLVRKYGKFNFLPQPGALPRDALRMEAQLPLGPRRGLVVVRFLNKRLLLGVTDQHITLLQEAGEHHDRDIEDFQELMEEAQRHKIDN